MNLLSLVSFLSFLGLSPPPPSQGNVSTLRKWMQWTGNTWRFQEILNRQKLAMGYIRWVTETVT